MAKDPDIDLGGEFEDYGEDFDFGFDSDGSDTNTDSNRSPVEKVKKGATAGFRSLGGGLKSGVAARLSSELPTTAGVYREVTNTLSLAQKTKDDFVKEIAPNIRAIKRLGKAALPRTRGYLPDKWQKKLESYFSEAEEWKSASKEEARDQAVS